MGTQVKAVADHNTKPNYATSTVAAGSVAIVDGEFAIFIGSTVPAQVAGWAGLTQCMQAMREAGWIDPTTLQFASAVYNVVTSVLTVVTDGAHPTLTEDDVAIIKGFGFSTSFDSCSTHTKRLFEKALEDVLKAA